MKQLANALLLFEAEVFAQSNTGSVTGTAFDFSQAVMSGVQITAMNLADERRANRHPEHGRGVLDPGARAQLLSSDSRKDGIQGTGRRADRGRKLRRRAACFQSHGSATSTSLRRRSHLYRSDLTIRALSSSITPCTCRH